MLAQLLWFEIKNRFKQPSSTIYFAVFFSLSFLMGIAFGGAFGIPITFNLSSKLALISPITIFTITTLVGYFGILIVAPIFGQSINKDYETGFYQILFATPIRKSTYFLTRFLGSFFSSTIILSSIGMGLWLASLMPFVECDPALSRHFWFYLSPFLTNIIPNILIFGAIFIAVAASFKKMALVYVFSVVIFTGCMIAEAMTQDLVNKSLAALLDPFGLTAAEQVIQYWSVVEQSANTIPLAGVFLYNRLLWGGIASCFLFATYFLFNATKSLKIGKSKSTHDNNFPVGLISYKVELFPQSKRVLWSLAVSEFKRAFSNISFLIILFCGISYIVFAGSFIGRIYGTETLPVTYQVLEVLTGVFYLFMAIITSFYAGELVWKDRSLNVYELIDSKPVSNLYLYLSKLFSLFFIQFFLLIIILVSSVLIQTIKGYYNYEWGLYFQYLFVFTLPSWILSSIFALFIQTVVKNKYMGHTIFILSYVLFASLTQFGFEHALYKMGSLPSVQYSDMNGFGTAYWSFSLFTLYWGAFYLFLAAISALVWQRGKIESWKERMRIKISLRQKKFIGIVLFSFSLLGLFIFYNTNILNEYETSYNKEQNAIKYERSYSYFEKTPHPELIAVNVHVDLFPEKQSMAGKGIFKYKNKGTLPIEKVLISLNKEAIPSELVWSKPVKLIEFNQNLGIQVYEFEEPILPNEEVNLLFKVQVSAKGFKNFGFSKKIVENGTFFHGSDYFPTIGYNSDGEIKNEKKRKKLGLPIKPAVASIDDSEALFHTYVSHEGTWIDFEATISTSSDQIAIAPGYLEKEWIEGGRRYFHYVMDRPILPFYAFLSGKYEVARDQWNGVNIEIYHHPTHTTNIARMIKSVKRSLDYYTQNFSPYQFRQVRIIEFPRYATFAQSFPNTIPYSEGIGFIAEVKNRPDDIDYPFYVTAHEVAHQWWAHQVIGGAVQGSTMLSESLAQYSALMVMEKEYGPEQMGKFLSYELDRYLIGRSQESKNELPLMLCENQTYLHYQKGSLVFYALKDSLGEDLVNKVLRDYIKDVAFQEAPFTRSIDLVTRFKQAAPDDKKYLIEDLFETITFHENEAKEATYRELPGGNFELELHSFNRKLRADGSGKESEIALDDYIDVGIYDELGSLQYLQKHKVVSGDNVFKVVVEKRPFKAGIDPLNKLIDKSRKKHICEASIPRVVQGSGNGKEAP